MEFEQVNDYIAKLYAGKKVVSHQHYVDETAMKDFIPTIDEDVARFLKLMIDLLRPKKILEIGTSIGYSTVTMALEVQRYDGHIVTVEYDEQVARQAQENFARMGVAGSIDLRLGDARQVLPQLKDSFDLVFMDADKHLYAPLLPECARLLRPGGVFLADDTLFPVLDLDPKWQDLVSAIEVFNRAMAEQNEMDSTILPIGDGFTVAVKRT